MCAQVVNAIYNSEVNSSEFGNTHNENIRIFLGLYIGRGRRLVAGLSRVNLSPERE